MQFSLIAAIDKNYGIGKNGRLPWHLSADLKYFNDTTRGNLKNAVIMGRLTWESISSKQRPLANRVNIVITRNASYTMPASVVKAASLEEAFTLAKKYNPEEIFVIGGAQIFYDAIRHPECQTIYLTEIDAVFECDTFFPKFDKNVFKKISESEIYEENGVKFMFVVYRK